MNHSFYAPFARYLKRALGKSVLSITLLLIIPITVCSTSYAQSNPSVGPNEEESRLERVVVTASRVPEWATRRAASTIVIDREQIQQYSARDVGDLLQFHAGMDIGRNGGPGQTTSVFVRGAESNHVLVLVDGVRINPGTIGVSAVQNIDPDLIERIEIVKGPRSTLYGSDAIGAVINIITRENFAPIDFELSAGAGSFGSRDLSAKAGIGQNDVGGNIGITWQQTDGYAVRDGATDDHGHENLSIAASTWQQQDNHRFVIDLWHSQGNTEYAGFSSDPAVPFLFLDQDHTNQTIKGSAISEFSSSWDSTFTLSYLVDKIEQNQPNFLAQFDFLETKRRALEWQNALSLDSGNRWILGVSGYNESVKALSFGTAIDEDTSEYGAYTEYALQGANHDASIGARYTDHDDFGGAFTWHIDSTYKLNSALQLVAAVGTGFRAPDASDRFGFGGNADLKPEESTTLELGLRYKLSERNLFSIRAFDQQIDNLINYVVTDFVTFDGINQNVDETETQGIELSHQFGTERLFIQTELIFQQPEDKNTGLSLLRRAERSLSSNAIYQWGGNTFGLNVLASGERADIDANTFARIESPGYVLANISYSRALSNQWTVRAKIDNVLDTFYQTANGFNTPERNYYLEFSYQSGR